MVTDYRVLNKAVLRPTHPFPSAAELVKRIDSTSKFFAKIDAVHGYFQIPLSERSSLMTTFLLPSGRYRYTSAPMGLCSSSDEFCRRSDEAVAGLGEWCLKIVDDILVQAPTEELLWIRLRATLIRCRMAGIKISNSKLETGKKVMFAGYSVSADGIRPNPEKVAAIRDFPTPKDVTDVRSFMGLANQLGHFIPDVSQMTVRLRDLLKKDTAFVWLPGHDAAFQRAKELLTSPMLVFPYDPRLPTELMTDASRLHGLGFALVQREPGDDRIRLVSCGSRSLTSCQRNYATIELECMGIKWAIEKCEFYLRGNQGFTVITDHKPLVGVFNKPLHELGNERLYRFRERLVDYTFEVKWCPGKDHQIADALSRAPVFPGEEDDVAKEAYIASVSAVEEFPALEDIFDAAAKSKSYLALIDGLERDVQNPHEHPELRQWSAKWQDLSLFTKGRETIVLVDGSRIAVPDLARRKLLQQLHVAHAGRDKTVRTAAQLYFWPNMRRDIQSEIDKCSECLTYSPSQKAMPLLPISAVTPMQMVACDLFQYAGRHWVCMVDRFSGFCWAQKLTNLDTNAVTEVLLSWFMEFGLPEVIRTDGGPQFRSAFKDFCDVHGIQCETSSPYNPQSNGLAENGVKAVKSLLKKTNGGTLDFKKALLEWRNAPRPDGVSPAYAFYGRKMKTLLPSLPQAVTDPLVGPDQVDQDEGEIDWDELRILDRQNRLLAKEQRRAAHKKSVDFFRKNPISFNLYEARAKRVAARSEVAAKYDQQHGATSLRELHVGDKVRIQHPVTKSWEERGTVRGVCERGRAVTVETDRNIFRRNRRYVKLDTASHASSSAEEWHSDADSDGDQLSTRARAAKALWDLQASQPFPSAASGGAVSRRRYKKKKWYPATRKSERLLNRQASSPDSSPEISNSSQAEKNKGGRKSRGKKQS